MLTQTAEAHADAPDHPLGMFRATARAMHPCRSMRTTLPARIRRNPAASYVLLTFAISWGGIVGVMVSTGTVVPPVEDFDRLVPVWSPLLVLGPTLASLVITAIVGGRRGWQDLRARLVKWSVPARWYAVALAAGPATFFAVCGALLVFSPAFAPGFVTAGDPGALVARGVAVAVMAGVLEEIGWTGFLTPVLRQRHGTFTTGLAVGLVWGLWHFLPKLFGAAVGGLGALWPLDMLCAIVGLTGFRVLMVWVHDRTRSVPIAMIMHAGLTGSLMVIQPSVTGAHYAVLTIALAAALWVVGTLPWTWRAVARHPVISYFVLTFALSWGGLVALVGPTHIIGTKEEFERLIPIAIPIVALGPMLASLILTALIDGRRGLRALWSRLTTWRVAGRWYAVALLLAPVYFTLVSLAFSLRSRDFLPGAVTASDPTSHVLFGLMGALVAGVVEEIGWTGFATPRLRHRFGAAATGIVIGALWALWHVLPKLWGAQAHGVLEHLPGDLACSFAGLIGYRILMVWLYDRTQSLLLAILMHAGTTAATLVVTPLVTGARLNAINYVIAAVPWVIIAVGGRRARRSRQRPRTSR